MGNISAQVTGTIAHGANTVRAASHTEGGPRPISLWTDVAKPGWVSNAHFAAGTKAGVLERKWSRTALADIPGSVEARADGVVDAAKGIADAAKNVLEAKGALATVKATLATVGATFETLTAAEQLLSVPFSAIPFPAMPAARIWDMAVAPPHGHLHPPNLVPPVPMVPLPSTGPILPIPYVSGAEKVLINGVPAARCGDIGASIWCGGYVPFYEILLGSCNVWIQGQRAARQGVDFTKHCIFSTTTKFKTPGDPPVGPVIGAIVTASPNVIIGGMPLPSFSAYAMGKAFKGLGWLGKKVLATKAGGIAKRATRGAMIGAGRIATKALPKEVIARFNRIVEDRMRALGIPAEKIGITEGQLISQPGSKAKRHTMVQGPAFDPNGNTIGSNKVIKGQGYGINVDPGILEPRKNHRLWNNASLDDRIDAVIAHEWAEMNSKGRTVGKRHLDALKKAPETPLPISPNARKLLEEQERVHRQGR